MKTELLHRSKFDIQKAGDLLRAGQVLLHSGGPAIYLRDAQKNFIAVYTVDGEMVATADWFAVAVKEE